MSIHLVGADAELIEFDTYPDGSFYTKFRPTLTEYNAMVCLATTAEELQKALYLKDALDARNINVKYLFLPYIPGGRQDRINAEGDFLWTLASVATDINARDFDSVITYDAHSSAAGDLIENLVDLPIANWDDFTDKYAGVIAPDKGAEMRAEEWGFQLGVPVHYAGKTRDVETGRLTGFTFPDVKPGHYILVDDICDGGGTFLGLAAEAPEGVTLDLYVTHGLFTKGTEDLVNTFGAVYCSTALLNNADGVVRSINQEY
jgi:ribose-phosphate pyrophosphokinase